MSALRITLITPAMASDPYWAAAPSRSTSTWSMALMGIRSRSAGAAPVLMPLIFKVALVWRRLPLTSTNTSAALKPRRLGARAMPLASQPVFSGRVSEGITALNASINPGLPVFCNCRALTTSIGTGLLVTVRCSAPRLPVTTTVDKVLSSWAWAAAANSDRVRAAVGCRICFISIPSFFQIAKSGRHAPGATWPVVKGAMRLGLGVGQARGLKWQHTLSSRPTTLLRRDDYPVRRAESESRWVPSEVRGRLLGSNITEWILKI